MEQICNGTQSEQSPYQMAGSSVHLLRMDVEWIDFFSLAFYSHFASVGPFSLGAGM
jgi:hypothetical protein